MWSLYLLRICSLQVRLQAQAVEVQWERAAIAEVLNEDYRQLLTLTQALDAAERQ
jgi:hypothetical protein